MTDPFIDATFRIANAVEKLRALQLSKDEIRMVLSLALEQKSVTKLKDQLRTVFEIQKPGKVKGGKI